MQKYVVLKWKKCNASFTRYTSRIVQNDILQLKIQFNLFYSNLYTKVRQISMKSS